MHEKKHSGDQSPRHTSSPVLSVAANYDSALVPELARYPVAEVYGKLPHDIVGGGRPAYLSGQLTFGQLADYVHLLAKHGIDFNYLLNSSCLGNREWSRSWQRRVNGLLQRLREAGVASVTVSTPYLLTLVKKRFPDFRVRVGIYAQVDTPRRARFWQDLGADAITLESFSINRNFQRLEQIREAVDCELHLLANHCCLPNCALQPYHQNGFAHASSETGRLFLDYCFFQCSMRRLRDPVNFIRASWIRPEDAGFYAQLGYSHLKLTERGLPSAELLKRTQAYSTQNFTGNLAELLLHAGLGQREKRGWFWMMRHFFRPSQLNPWKLRNLRQLALKQGMLEKADVLPVHIDNARIPVDFVAGFRNRDCTVLDCRQCGYCDEIANSAVTVNEDYRARSCLQLEQLENELTDGGLWHV